MFLLLAALLTLVHAAPRMAPEDLPPDLQPWVPWVLAEHPELRCPVVEGHAACLWPGLLALQADGRGARFRLEVTLDRDLAVPLPGEDGAWPLDVRVDGAARPVRAEGDRPVVDLPAGRHVVTGRFDWPTMPPALALPPLIGRVDLAVDGRPVLHPRVGEDGRLRLGTGERDAAAPQSVEVNVSRLVRVGAPWTVETRLDLRVSGPPRELVLDDPLPPGTRPVELSGEVPARLERVEGGTRLRLQVRAGAWSVRLLAVHDGPVRRLEAPAAAPPWPETEVWVVEPDDRLEAVSISGAPSVDPQRTHLPAEWRGHTAWLVERGRGLDFETLRRGEPDPPPNDLRLHRTAWLDLAGGALTFQDRFEGELHRGWRLDIAPPARLTHARASGEDLLITRAGGTTGIELRQEQLDLVAESRLEHLGGSVVTLPAVGWTTDVQQLGVDLNLPPGWRLLAARGADRVRGAELSDWTLLDMLAVFLVALAAWKLHGRMWGGLVLLGLALSWTARLAPLWPWPTLVALVAIERALQGRKAGNYLRVGRLAVAVATLAAVASFSVEQVQRGLFPVLERPGEATSDYVLLDEGLQLNLPGTAR